MMEMQSAFAHGQFGVGAEHLKLQIGGLPQDPWRRWRLETDEDLSECSAVSRTSAEEVARMMRRLLTETVESARAALPIAIIIRIGSTTKER